MAQTGERTRRVGDVRRLNLLSERCYGPHGAQLGLAYLLSGHSRIQPVVPFHVRDEIPPFHSNKRWVQVAVVRHIVDQLPEGTDRRLLLGATVITSCLVDAEESPRGEDEKRFRYLGGFVVRTPGARPVNITPPDISSLDIGGAGLLSPVTEGAHTVNHAIVMPHPRYAVAHTAVRLTDAFSPVYAAVHDTVPEVIVDRHELGLGTA